MLGFFSRNSEEYKKNAIGLAKIEPLYFPSMGLLIGLSTLLTIMIGGLYYINSPGRITYGDITEFVIYINMLMFPVSAIGWTASMIQRASASQKRLNEFLHTEPVIRDAEKTQHVKIKGNIYFRQVGFTYPHTAIRALRNFNLEIRSGDKVAIVGKTGSGKSTVAQLLLRMYDVTTGSLEIEGINIKQIPLKELREQISYVPQDVFLFSDSVENNIAFGASANPDDGVKQAAYRANIHDEIMHFSEKYDTPVGERGVTLSGGQKQRISIARALNKESNLIIFDDCLSAVDMKTENEIVDRLQSYLEGRTAVVITHRIFALFGFTKIIVLEDGEIVETGTHEQLLARNGYYAGIYKQQQEMEKSA